MKLLLATNNLHKKIELEALFPQWQLLLPGDIGLAGWDHDETADSFQGNALGKARSLWLDSGQKWPVMADDSGLCIDALHGAPGIFSARYGQAEAGRKLTDTEKNQLVLSQMAGVSDRTARFVCALALVLGSHRCFIAEESWEGEIGQQIIGEHGFGYDPIFYLPAQKTMSAQLLPEQKNQLSHRYRAARRLAAVVADLENFA